MENTTLIRVLSSKIAMDQDAVNLTADDLELRDDVDLWMPESKDSPAKVILHRGAIVEVQTSMLKRLGVDSYQRVGLDAAEITATKEAVPIDSWPHETLVVEAIRLDLDPRGMDKKKLVAAVRRGLEDEAKEKEKAEAKTAKGDEDKPAPGKGKK